MPLGSSYSHYWLSLLDFTPPIPVFSVLPKQSLNVKRQMLKAKHLYHGGVWSCEQAQDEKSNYRREQTMVSNG